MRIVSGLFVIACVLVGCGTEEIDTRDGESADTESVESGGDVGHGLDTGTTESGGSDGGFSCSASQRTTPSAEPDFYQCERDAPEDPWMCDCAGETFTDATDRSCLDTLESVCGVDRDPNYCEESPGVCMPTDDGFTCRCTDDAEDSASTAATCDDAIHDACVPGCAIDGLGNCDRVSRDGFACLCDDGLSGTVTPDRAGDCSSHLREFCSESCTSENGVCLLGLDGASFDCTCTSVGESTNYPWSALGHEDCARALDGHCGAPDSEPTSCSAESSDGTASGSCTVQPSGEWRCSCTTPDSSGSEGGSDGSRTPCEERLRLICPEAFE